MNSTVGMDYESESMDYKLCAQSKTESTELHMALFFLSWGQGGSVCFPTNCSEEAWEGLIYPNHRQHIFSHLTMQTVVSHAESQAQPSKLGSTLSTYIYKAGVSIHKTLYTLQTHPTIDTQLHN